MTPELLAAFKSVSGKGEQSPHFPALVAWLRETLADNLPGNRTWETIHLLQHLDVDARDKSSREAKRVSQALWRLRASGKINDCWRHDTTRRFMGHPVILWQRPMAPDATQQRPLEQTDIDEGIF
jgi:hypothetical protein